jgi:hypothetical protein
MNAETVFAITGTVAAFVLAGVVLDPIIRAKLAARKRRKRLAELDRLRRDNARMQAAKRQWDRCDRAAAYLERHKRSL